MPKPGADIPALLRQVRSSHSGNDGAAGQLHTVLYEELREVASALMRGERAGHTLQPTALVHEAFLKLASLEPSAWNDRACILGIATRAMRQVLVDHARHRGREKRGHRWQRVTLVEAVLPDRTLDVDVLDLDRALEQLAKLDERVARVCELRIFGGLERQEIADSLSISLRTVAEDWSMARRWLARQLFERNDPA